MRFFLIVVASGCVTSERMSDPSEADPGTVAAASGMRGPGEWRPAPRTHSAVSVELGRDLVVRATSIDGGATGEHLLFTTGDAACAVDTSTGAMTTDVDTGGDSADTGGPADTEVMGTFEDDDLLVRSGRGLLRVSVSGSEVERVAPGAALAVVIAGEVVGVDADCTVSWGGRTPMRLAGTCADAAADGDALWLATGDALVRLGADGFATSRPGRADLVAVSNGVALAATLDGSHLATDTWSTAWPGAMVLGVHGGDLGLFLVDGIVGDERLVRVLDAATGEDLGVLALRGSTRAVDVSDSGTLLVQQRADAVTTWTLSR